MGLSELIQTHMTTGNEDADYLTRVIFNAVLADGELVQTILMPALHRAVYHHMRQMALAAEKQSLLSNKPTADPVADRLAFLKEKFYVPGVGFVPWGEATIEHHTLRISYLSDKAQSILDTAARHEVAITQIKEAKAKNLNEVHKPRRQRKAS